MFLVRGNTVHRLTSVKNNIKSRKIARKTIPFTTDKSHTVVPKYFFVNKKCQEFLFGNVHAKLMDT